MSALVVMAKSPLPGRVKTRLCPPLSPGEAASVARAALEDTLVAVTASRAPRCVLALEGPVPAWMPPIPVIAQRGNDLGTRLGHALKDVGCPALIIGMDSPQATTSLLDDALEALDTRGTGAVLGLSTDGGWWALGANRWHPNLFRNVPMSSPATGLAQAAQLESLGLEITMLPVLRDIDRWADAVEVAAQTPGSRLAAAVTDLRLGTGVPV